MLFANAECGMLNYGWGFTPLVKERKNGARRKQFFLPVNGRKTVQDASSFFYPSMDGKTVQDVSSFFGPSTNGKTVQDASKTRRARTA